MNGCRGTRGAPARRGVAAWPLNCSTPVASGSPGIGTTGTPGSWAEAVAGRTSAPATASHQVERTRAHHRRQPSEHRRRARRFDGTMGHRDNAQKPLELILARNLLTSISTPAFLVDAEGVLLFYNEAAGALLGIPFEEAGRMGPEEWGSRFGPFTSNAQPIPLEQLPLTIALREGRPAHSAFRIHSAPGTSTTSRSARCRSRPPRPRARSRSSGRPTCARKTGRPRDEGQDLGRARLGSRPRARDEPLRRQHLLRPADAVRRRDPDPRRRNRHPRARDSPFRRDAEHQHPAHPPPPRPHPGADVLPAVLQDRLADHDLGAILARGLARAPCRALHLGAAVPGRGARASLRRLVPRHAGERVGDRLGADQGRVGHAPRADARVPDHRGRRHLCLHPRPRAGPGRAARQRRAGVDLGLRPGPRRRSC